ncbi:hypothetical protein [Streptomyces spongiae]|uniref:Uncharacterized protein n=1 Tax=Streptomyces spongiae TaxID=565072 RepID=A0A5N8XRV3_9ACTN|nr:hypothetical protein [Streptomyces spongiae]MPY61345.1 hypothetical protein [Streptomyces spongiae]
MPADEETRGAAVGESRARSGPRHAAPKKPLLTRIQVPAGKAIAVAAMPTAVLMGMGFTSTLARADDKPSAKSLAADADEYKDCVAALDAEKDREASPSPSDSASDSASDEKSDEKSDGKDEQDSSSDDSSGSGTSGGDSSSDSGSDDKTEPTPSPSTSAPSGSSQDDSSAATPSPSESSGNLLDTIGGALEDVFTPDEKETEDAAATPSPSASASKDASDTVEDTEKKVTDTAKDATDSVEDTAKGVTDEASKAAKDATEKATDAVGDATATPSPSASTSTAPEDCPTATDDEGGVETGIPPLADDPWYLEASSLLLKGADYQGIVKVKTADGSVKKVLKYVISDGSDIGDLHQTVVDKQAGKTYHVQAGKGTTSTIRDGKTVMYTESISGNLLGLIPITFDPEHPPPLNIPLIYFTNVKVTQAAQFGGTLTVPGMHQYTTD